jgi:transcriptional regulator with XRE-family HTH domain
MNLEIAKRLVELRETHKFSREQLAEKLEVSVDLIIGWEEGDLAAETSDFIALSKLYGISVVELVNGNGQNKEISQKIKEIEKTLEQQAPQTKKTSSVEKRKCFIYSKGFRLFKIILLSTLLAYFVCALVTECWHPTWIMFLITPSVASVIDIKKFVYTFPLMLTGVYFSMGFLWELWHPGWAIFLIIPFFYIAMKKVYANNGENKNAA